MQHLSEITSHWDFITCAIFVSKVCLTVHRKTWNIEEYDHHSFSDSDCSDWCRDKRNLLSIYICLTILAALLHVDLAKRNHDDHRSDGETRNSEENLPASGNVWALQRLFQHMVFVGL